ncbi:MAG TPA: DUF2283 domain-containing protein [Methylotenera sp.]|nr:DUF2283 domain-containing protein [Methylotenera sp.]
MKTLYYPEDDILELIFNNKEITRETSQDWNVNVSYAADGSIVQMVILDAVAAGLIPFHSEQSRIAA